MPACIDEYAADPWDLRVSIDQHPLDESFYITIPNPELTSRSIQDLVNDYVLNPLRKIELDIKDDPDLPFYMDELAHHFEAQKMGQLSIEFYINHGDKVQAHDRAKQHLSVCTYDDKSWDYRLLDLVIKTQLTETPQWEKSKLEKMYDRFFLLHLMSYHQWTSLKKHTSNKLKKELSTRFRSGLENEYFTIAKNGFEISDVSLNAAGGKFIEKLDHTLTEYDHKYGPFGSVSIEPPALGVEQGFDVSLQMMEFDGIDIQEAIIHKIIDSQCDELLDERHWQQHYINRRGLDEALAALAYKTHFSGETLVALKDLATN